MSAPAGFACRRFGLTTYVKYWGRQGHIQHLCRANCARRPRI